MKIARGRLTVLADNAVRGKSEALGEHGFSAFLETESGSFLFDAGKGKTVVHNASVYQKDLRSINKIAVSHSHGDHTGGLPEVLRALPSKPIDVHAHPDIFADRFRKEQDKNAYGGIPFARGYLEKMGARFVFNKEYLEIEDAVFLTGEVPRKTSFEGGDMGGRFMVRDGETIPDVIPDDQSLVIRAAKGILIVLGCAHAGVVNVVNHAIERSGVDRILGIVGGTHIDFSGEEQLEKTVEALKRYRIERLVPSHCTGPEAAFRLKAEFDKVFQFSHVGASMEF